MRVLVRVQVAEVTRLLEVVSRRTEQVKKKHDVILSASTRDDGELCALFPCAPIRQVFLGTDLCFFVFSFYIDAATGVSRWGGNAWEVGVCRMTSLLGQ